MKLVKITEPAEALAIRQAYFSFEVPSNISVLVHEFRIDGQAVGYVATEDYNTVGGPHLAVKEGYRNAAFMTKVKWLIQNVYYPLMKAQGKEFLVTTCSPEDAGTTRILKECGFNIDTHVIAEYKL